MLLLLLACTGESAGTGTAIPTEGFFVAEEGREHIFRYTDGSFGDTGDLGTDELVLDWTMGGCGDWLGTLSLESSGAAFGSLEISARDTVALCGGGGGAIDPPLTLFEAEVQQDQSWTAGGWTSVIDLTEGVEAYYGTFSQVVDVTVSGGSGVPSGWTLSFAAGPGLMGIRGEGFTADLIFVR